MANDLCRYAEFWLSVDVLCHVGSVQINRREILLEDTVGTPARSSVEDNDLLPTPMQAISARFTVRQRM